MDPGVRCHGMKANPTGYLCSKYECFLMSGYQDIDSLKTLTKWNGNGNGNAYDRGDYNSSFALRAVELKICFLHMRKQRCRPAAKNLLFAYAKTKVQASCTVTMQLLSAFVFAT